MAFADIRNVSIRGVAACVPGNRLDTVDIPLFNEVEAEKFINTTGIKSRRIAEQSMCASDLCLTAAEKLIEELGWDKREIDALIFVSVTADYRSPATSCILQDRMRLPNTCLTFDISSVCCGYLQGLTVVSSLLSSGSMKKALLLVGDTNSVTSSPEDKTRFPLLGDAGTATALEYSEVTEPIYSHIMSDGSYYKSVINPKSGFREMATPEDYILHDYGKGVKRANIHGYMDGLEVFSYAINALPKVVKELCDYYHIDLNDDIDYFLFHQANRKINEKVKKKLGIPDFKVPCNIFDFGNTSSSAIPLLMVTNLRAELINEELSLMMSAIGAGFVWGSLYLKTTRIVCPELIEM